MPSAVTRGFRSWSKSSMESQHPCRPFGPDRTAGIFEIGVFWHQHRCHGYRQRRPPWPCRERTEKQGADRPRRTPVDSLPRKADEPQETASRSANCLQRAAERQSRKNGRTNGDFLGDRTFFVSDLRFGGDMFPGDVGEARSERPHCGAHLVVKGFATRRTSRMSVIDGKGMADEKLVVSYRSNLFADGPSRQRSGLY